MSISPTNNDYTPFLHVQQNQNSENVDCDICFEPKNPHEMRKLFHKYSALNAPLCRGEQAGRVCNICLPKLQKTSCPFCRQQWRETALLVQAEISSDMEKTDLKYVCQVVAIGLCAGLIIAGVGGIAAWAFLYTQTT